MRYERVRRENLSALGLGLRGIGGIEARKCRKKSKRWRERKKTKDNCILHTLIEKMIYERVSF
jgi:hypothetical protein